MSNSINEAVRDIVQDLLNAGVKTSFTKKDLDALGIVVPKIELSKEQIKAIRMELNLSQMVFAKLLNISLSSVRQWEQGKRHPTGATKVLLELLQKTPHILDYRLCA